MNFFDNVDKNLATGLLFYSRRLGWPEDVFDVG